MKVVKIFRTSLPEPSKEHCYVGTPNDRMKDLSGSYVRLEDVKEILQLKLDWLKSEDVWIEDEEGNKLPNAVINSRKGSMEEWFEKFNKDKLKE